MTDKIIITLRKIRTIFSIFAVLGLTLNFIKSDPGIVDISSPEVSIQDTTNIIISINWTGSITWIPNHKQLLKTAIRDTVESIIQRIADDQALNISFSYFGLKKPDNEYWPAPDFHTNYIKTFLSDQTRFSKNDWGNLIDNLDYDNYGYQTASTVAKQFSILYTKSTTRYYDNNYLILITDGYKNLASYEIDTDEMVALRGYNKSAYYYEKINNIDFAERLAIRFNQMYQLPVDEESTIQILPYGISREDQHFYIMVTKIQRPKIIPPSQLIEYPEKFVYEMVNTDSIRIRTNMSYKYKEFSAENLTPVKIIVRAIDPNNNYVLGKQQYFGKSIPKYFYFPDFGKNRFKLIIETFNNFDDQGLWQKYREKFIITSNCSQAWENRILGIIPVKGHLLQIHDKTIIFRGQKTASRFWSFIFIIIFLCLGGIWCIPKIVPPVPGIDVTYRSLKEEA